MKMTKENLVYLSENDYIALNRNGLLLQRASFNVIIKSDTAKAFQIRTTAEELEQVDEILALFAMFEERGMITSKEMTGNDILDVLADVLGTTMADILEEYEEEEEEEEEEKPSKKKKKKKKEDQDGITTKIDKGLGSLWDSFSEKVYAFGEGSKKKKKKKKK